MSEFDIQSFGFHQCSFHDIANPAYSARAKIVDSLEIDLKPELVKNEGGSSPVPFSVAPGRTSGEITATFKGITKELVRFFTPWSSSSETEDTDGESAGSITTATNLSGTSVIDASTGIATIALDGSNVSSLAPGKYKVVATSATTVDIYVDYDGTGKVTYQDNALKVNSSAITIAASTGTDTLGLTLTGGSGTIGMTTGDIAVFEVLPVSDYLLTQKHGIIGGYHREFLLRAYSEVNTRGGINVFEAYRCVAFGNMGNSMMNKDFSSWEVTIQILKPNASALTMAQAFNSDVGNEFARSYYLNQP